MSSGMQKWLGLAAFADGWLNQDEQQQEQQLQYLEGIADVAGRAQNIRGAQSSERRAAALFPGQQEQQDLTTTQLGIETRGMQRGEESQSQIDAYLQENFGMSKDMLDTIVTMKELGIEQASLDELMKFKVPQAKAQLESTKLQTEQRTESQFAQGAGPEAVGDLRRDTALLGQEKTEYERLVTDLRNKAGLPRIMVDTEKVLQELAPLGKRIDMVSAYAAAKLKMGQAANTPLGKEQIMRDIMARKGLDYDSYKVREFLVDAGEMESKQTLMNNIWNAERLRAELLTREQDVDSATALMGAFMTENENIANQLGRLMPEKPRDVEQILAPLNKYINANKALMWEYHHVSYDRLTDRQLQFSTQDLNEVIGGMLQNFSGFNDENAEDIREFLVKVINQRDPIHWNTVMQRLRPGLVQRWSQEDWFAAQQVLDTVQWRMGQEEDPDLVRPRPPYLGQEKKMILPLGALQRSERQKRIEGTKTGGVDTFLDNIMGEAEAELQLDSVEAELEKLLAQ